MPLLLSLPGRAPAAAAPQRWWNTLICTRRSHKPLGYPFPPIAKVPACCRCIRTRGVVEAAAFSQYPRGKDLMGYSVRSERYRYTEWIARPSGDIVARELYDHSVTATPSANLAALPAHAATVREHSALLDRGQGWRKLQIR